MDEIKEIYEMIIYLDQDLSIALDKAKKDGLFFSPNSHKVFGEYPPDEFEKYVKGGQIKWVPENWKLVTPYDILRNHKALIKIYKSDNKYIKKWIKKWIKKENRKRRKL
jgi:hypothetical protein